MNWCEFKARLLEDPEFTEEYYALEQEYRLLETEAQRYMRKAESEAGGLLFNGEEALAEMAADERHYGYYGEDAPGFPAWLRERGLGPGVRVPVPSRFGELMLASEVVEKSGMVKYRLAAESLEAVRKECQRLFGKRRKRGIALRGRPSAAAAMLAACAGWEKADLPLPEFDEGGWTEEELFPGGDMEELELELGGEDSRGED